MSLFTDNEGGNIRLVSPGGIIWEIDAYNENLRIFRYAEGSNTTMACSIVITKDGVLEAPQGIAGLGTVGGTFGEFGYGSITFHGHVSFVEIINTVILKIRGVVSSRSSMSNSDWALGIDLSKILKTFGLDANYIAFASSLQVYRSDGTFSNNAFGYAGGLGNGTADGKKILTPMRIYTTNGDTGKWPSASDVYSPGTTWIAEVILQR